MVFNIILNSSNVTNSNNTFYSKSFIGGCLTIPQGSEICCSQIVIPYSWFNIASSYNNTTFAYYWNGYYPSTIWNGAMSGTTFTGSADSGSSGTFAAGQLVIGSNLPAGTTISSVSTSSVVLSNTFTTSSPTVITGIPTFTGYITMTTINGTSTPILTLSSTVTGSFALNTVLYSSDSGLAQNVYVSSLYSGTLGDVGSTYILSSEQTVSVGSSGSPIKFGFIGTYHSITIPDGFYEISEFNIYLQTYMISQNQYIYNSTLLQNQYFMDLRSNPVYYANQFILQAIPSSFTQYTAANSSYSYTLPSGFAFSPHGYTQQIDVANYITDYLGLTAGTYPSAPTTSSNNVLSNTTPIGSYVNSVVVRCNLVSNTATMPTDVLDTFYPNTTFGNNIVYQPPYEKWVDIIPGTYNNIYISFEDQDGNQIYAQDSNVMISLLLKFNYSNIPVELTSPAEIPKVQTINSLDFRD